MMLSLAIHVAKLIGKRDLSGRGDDIMLRNVSVCFPPFMHGLYVVSALQ
jgi:hypothetical protein